jgi:glucan phosphoethanolaminetransferase (alkaline phosphatase superfamily)
MDKNLFSNRFALMKRNKLESYQWMKFFEHWWFLSIVIVFILAAELFIFFSNLNGTPWIYFSAISFILMLIGAGLIAFAKIPAYRSGRFFTFGVKSVPEQLAGYYKWGWRLFLSGVILSLCLFLSKR